MPAWPHEAAQQEPAQAEQGGVRDQEDVTHHESHRMTVWLAVVRPRASIVRHAASVERPRATTGVGNVYSTVFHTTRIRRTDSR